jgi:hypothetical protein
MKKKNLIQHFPPQKTLMLDITGAKMDEDNGNKEGRNFRKCLTSLTKWQK